MEHKHHLALKTICLKKAIGITAHTERNGEFIVTVRRELYIFLRGKKYVFKT